MLNICRKCIFPINKIVSYHKNFQVRSGSLHPGELHPVCHGQVLALRVEQPSPLRHRERRHGEPVLNLKLVLVYHGNFSQTGNNYREPFVTFIIFMGTVLQSQTHSG